MSKTMGKAMSKAMEKAMEDQHKVYVIGHQNPDTDSVCSAIAYANLKNCLEGEHCNRYKARRAGQMNGETTFVLDYFGVKVPKLLPNLRQQVKNLELHQMRGIKGSTSIKEAWALMKEEKIKTLPITRDEKLEGLITMSDITTSYMDVYDSKVLSAARTQYRNIAETIGGKVLLGNSHSYLLDGKISVGASSPAVMRDFINENDLVIVGRRKEAQQCALDLNVGCMVVCQITQETEITSEIIKEAKEKEIVLITSPYDTFTVARLINQSIPVRYFMTKKDLITFNMWDYVEEVKEVMTQYKHGNFPVVDKEGNFLGFISRRRLLNVNKKQVILVDHNEKGQAVDGIEEAEILEIIDHHKLGDIETIGPVYFRNQPLGCTATIVYQMYQENGVEVTPSIAGILCAAILSDTLMFRSPTCTSLDEKVARELAEIADIDVEEFAQKMFVEGSNLKGKTAEEICFMDFKQFTAGGVSFGVGQVTFLTEKEQEEIKEKISSYLDTARTEHGLDMIFIMLTNIITETTELLCCGDGAKEKALTAFHQSEKEEKVILKGVVSRKKQLIPSIVSVLQQA